MFLSATDAMRWLVHDCYGEGDKVSSILVVAGQNDHEGLGAEPGVKSLSFLGGFLEDFECWPKEAFHTTKGRLEII